MRRLAIFFVILFGSAAWSDDGIDIIEPRRVTALTELQERIDTISAAVAECTGSGRDHNECLCDNQALILGFRKAVEELFETFPDLETKDIVRFKTSDKLTVSQNLSGIKNQAQMKLSCT